MSVVLAVLRQINCESEAEAIERAWRGFVESGELERSTSFDLCYSSDALSSIADAAVAAFRECGVTGFDIDKPGLISGMLQDAWYMFWSPTQSYEDWETDARLRLLSKIS